LVIYIRRRTRPNSHPDISIDGDTAVAFTENVEQRFLSYGWQVLHVDDGDRDLAGIQSAIEEAQKEKNKPTIIRLRTIIGYGSKQQGTHGVHGSRKLKCLQWGMQKLTLL
jgi:transketolase